MRLFVAISCGSNIGGDSSCGVIYMGVIIVVAAVTAAVMGCQMGWVAGETRSSSSRSRISESIKATAKVVIGRDESIKVTLQSRAGSAVAQPKCNIQVQSPIPRAGGIVDYESGET